MAYEIVSFDLDSGYEMLVLAREGSKPFIEKLINSKQFKDRRTCYPA